jgi:hypothetical protein
MLIEVIPAFGFWIWILTLFILEVKNDLFFSDFAVHQHRGVEKLVTSESRTVDWTL